MALDNSEAEEGILLEVAGAKKLLADAPEGHVAGSPLHLDNLNKFAQIRGRLLAKYEPIITAMLDEKLKAKLSTDPHLVGNMICLLLSCSARYVTFAGGMPPGGMNELKQSTPAYLLQFVEGLNQQILDAVLQTFDDDVLMFIREARDLPLADIAEKLSLESLLSRKSVSALLDPAKTDHSTGTLAHSEATSEAKETVPPSDLRILQVEDDPNIRVITNMYLQSGFGLKNAVQSVPTLRDAINAVEQLLRDEIPLHGIISDEEFPTSPGMGASKNAEFFVRYIAGLLAKPEFAGKLKTLRTIIFMTGSGEEDQRAVLEKLLPPDFVVRLLPKPIKMLPVQKVVIGALVDAKTVSAEDAAPILAKVEDPI